MRLDTGVRRVPLLSGSRVALVPTREEDVVLRPPPPPDQVVDVAAAVRDALRFPLSGPPLAESRPRGRPGDDRRRAPRAPVPGAQQDPRPEALAATIDELWACGVPDTRQTILVAGGLGRRYGQRELERLLPPPRARARSEGRVVVHDAEDAGSSRSRGRLASTPRSSRPTSSSWSAPRRPCSRRPRNARRRLRRRDRARPRRSGLLDRGGRRLRVGSASSDRGGGRPRPRRCSVSLVLDLPRLTGTYRGYPYEPEAVRHVVRSPFPAALRAASRRSCAGTSSRGRRAGSTRSPRSRARPRSRTQRPSCAASSSAGSGSTSPWTRSSWGALDRAAPPARDREPCEHRRGRARARAPPAPGRVPGPRGRDARPRPSALALVRPGRRRSVRGVFAALRSRPRPRGARGRGAGGGRGRAGDRRLPLGTDVPPAAALRRLGGMRAGALAARPGRRRRLSRRDRRPHARVRAEPRDRRARWRWRTASPEDRPRSASCSRPPYAPLLVGGARRPSPRRGRSCGPARSSAGSPARRARSRPVSITYPRCATSSAISAFCSTRRTGVPAC